MEAVSDLLDAIVSSIGWINVTVIQFQSEHVTSNTNLLRSKTSTTKIQTTKELAERFYIKNLKGE